MTISATIGQVPEIFDKNLLKLHRARAAENFPAHDFLFREMASRLSERLDFIKRDFPLVLNLGAKNGFLNEFLNKNNIKTIIHSELSEPMLKSSDGLKLVASEELLPFADNSFDLVMSVGALHWVNDLAGTLIQIRRVLKPDGLFLAVLFGGNTLNELRKAFEKAEIEARGGVSPRISPFIDVQSGGGLLQRAGFVLPVVDSEILTVEYSHPLKLMKDLRGMGETNAIFDRAKTFTPCSLLMTAVDNYIRDFSNKKELVTASFELITLTGWKSAK